MQFPDIGQGIVDTLRHKGPHMRDPIMSPDGKFIWSGTGWIPAPPGETIVIQNEAVISYPSTFEKSKSNQDLPIDIPKYLTSPTNTRIAKNQSGSVLKVFGSIFVLVLVVFLFVNRSLFFDNLVDEFSDWDGDGISDANDPDDDNDGFMDENDWYDKGDGGLVIEFIKFEIWSNGDYDSGGNPDVYAYVGIGDGDCNGMQYFAYLDDINEDVSIMHNWKTYVANIDEDQNRACVSVTIYDEDSWAPDEILDFVPGSSNYYIHPFVLSSGEGEVYVFEDNRGENDLSILLEYQISRSAVVPA